MAYCGLLDIRIFHLLSPDPFYTKGAHGDGPPRLDTVAGAVKNPATRGSAVSKSSSEVTIGTTRNTWRNSNGEQKSFQTGAAASLRQFGDEAYRHKLARGSEGAEALFEEADVIVRKYKDVLGAKEEYYPNEYVWDGFSSNVVTQDSPLALHTDPHNTTISCLTGCNPNTDRVPWKGGEFLVADGCYAFDLEPGCAVLGHDAKNIHGVVPLRPENGKGPECVRYSFVQYSKHPCYERTRGEAEARARGDPVQLKKDADKAAKEARDLARAARNNKRKRE